MGYLEEAQKHLDKKLKERRERALALHEQAEPIKDLGGRTTRRFAVTLYEENTEYLACLEMLSQISDWFSVVPVQNVERQI